LVEGTEYRINGWMRCFGTNTTGMTVSVGEDLIWTPAASETWTEFDVEHTPATDGTLTFSASVSSYDSEFYVEFDDVTVWATDDEPEGALSDGLDHWTAGNDAVLTKVEGGP
jgi:hypothetical protein